MLHTIFDHTFYIKEFENLGKFEPYRKIFTKQLINLGHGYIDDSKHDPDIQKRGNLISSLSNPKDFQNLFGFSLLLQVLKPAIIEAKDIMFKNMKIKNVIFSRAWHNINYKNSYVVSHVHRHKNPKLKVQVCILYLESPENSGKFVIIDDDRADLRCIDFDQDKVHYITVKPNMLICHDCDVNHAVSEHLSDERRICIIFEYLLMLE